jgi:hypothetical protein
MLAQQLCYLSMPSRSFGFAGALIRGAGRLRRLKGRFVPGPIFGRLRFGEPIDLRPQAALPSR